MARRAPRTSFEPRSCSREAASLRGRGFTIVELLIVIVVIAILAAITIVAYSGIQDRAKASAAQATAKQAYTTITGYAVEHADTYPADLATAGLANSGDTSYQYRVNNSANPKTFCLTTTKNSVSYFVSNSASSPAAGACAGHGVNGGSTITNLATDPVATSLTVASGGAGWTNTNWFGSGGAGSYSLVQGASDGPAGSPTYVRKTWSTAPANNAATGIRNTNSSTSGFEVSAGQQYTFSSYLRSSKSQSNAAAMRVEWSNAAGTQISYNEGALVSLPAGTWTRLSIVVTAPSSAAYVGVISHVTGGTTWAASDRLDGGNFMITQGSSLPAFAYGASPGWAWNGTPNNSTSTGPPL